MSDLDELLWSDAERWLQDRPAISLDRTVAAAITTPDKPPGASDEPIVGDGGAPEDPGRFARWPKARVLAPLLSAAAIVIIAASLTLAGAFDHTGKSAQPPTPPTASPSVPAGYKLVSYRAIQIAVPKSLAVTHSPCRAPVNAVLVPNGAAYSCPAPPPGGGKPKLPTTATGVWLDQTPYGAISTTREPTERRTVAGVSIVVRAPTRAEVHAILASVRTITVDKLGCPTHPASLTPSGQPPAAELIPPGATSAVVCEFAPVGRDHTYWLVGSYRLAVATVARLAEVVNALPARAQKPDSFLPLYAWVRIAYPSGTTRVIAFRTNYEPTFVTDGQRTVIDTHPGIDLLPLLRND